CSSDLAISAHLLPQHHAWCLLCRSRLLADTTDLTIGSPATRGRTGAGYGGLFWRVSGEEIPTRAQVDGGAEPLGSTSPWLLLTQARPSGPVSRLLPPPRQQIMPWFVRTSGYVGAGPAVAWQSERHLAQGEELELTLAGVLADRILDEHDASALYETLEHMW